MESGILGVMPVKTGSAVDFFWISLGFFFGFYTKLLRFLIFFSSKLLMSLLIWPRNGKKKN